MSAQPPRPHSLSSFCPPLPPRDSKQLVGTAQEHSPLLCQLYMQAHACTRTRVQVLAGHMQTLHFMCIYLLSSSASSSYVCVFLYIYIYRNGNAFILSRDIQTPIPIPSCNPMSCPPYITQRRQHALQTLNMRFPPQAVLRSSTWRHRGRASHVRPLHLSHEASQA